MGTVAAWSGVCVLAFAGGGEPVPREYQGKTMPARIHADPQAMAAGKAIYEGKVDPAVNCVFCHGRDGKPTRLAQEAPDFSDPGVQAQDFDIRWFWRTSEGKPGTKMPGYKSKLTEEQRWQVIVYMRSLARTAK